MCIIACKPAGVPMPDKEIIENMWYANHDGAGIMYADKKRGVVVIEKGFMALADFEAKLDELGGLMDLTDTALVMHFRIGTAGGNTPANTHPFPITDNIPVLQKLRCAVPVGVAHNGVIPITPRRADISDTMEFIAAALAPLHRSNAQFMDDPEIALMIKNLTNSKWAFLTADGVIHTIGDFQEYEGIRYSNGSYIGWTSAYRGYSNGMFPELASGLMLDRSLDSFEVVLSGAPEGSYVVSSTGAMMDDSFGDFLLDATGGVYWYDMESDMAIELEDVSCVYTPDGKMAAYDADNAWSTAVSWEVITVKDLIELFDGLED